MAGNEQYNRGHADGKALGNELGYREGWYAAKLAAKGAYDRLVSSQESEMDVVREIFTAIIANSYGSNYKKPEVQRGLILDLMGEEIASKINLNTLLGTEDQSEGITALARGVRAQLLRDAIAAPLLLDETDFDADDMEQEEEEREHMER